MRQFLEDLFEVLKVNFWVCSIGFFLFLFLFGNGCQIRIRIEQHDASTTTERQQSCSRYEPPVPSLSSRWLSP